MKETRNRRGKQATREVGRERLFPSGLSVGYKSDLLTTLSGPGGGYVDGNDISRNTKAPTTTKVIKPQTEGEPPSAPQKWGQEWGAHKGMGEFFKIFFCNFLLLKTFPKKCVFSFMSG